MSERLVVRSLSGSPKWVEKRYISASLFTICHSSFGSYTNSTSMNLFGGLPLFILPGSLIDNTLCPVYPLHLLCTWPKHFSLASQTISALISNLVYPVHSQLKSSKNHYLAAKVEKMVPGKLLTVLFLVNWSTAKITRLNLKEGSSTILLACVFSAFLQLPGFCFLVWTTSNISSSAQALRSDSRMTSCRELLSGPQSSFHSY